MIEMHLSIYGGRGADSGLTFVSPSSTSSPTLPPGFSPVEVAPDLKTALGQKGKPYSISDALSRVNPDLYSDNCQRCVVAYELLRRGYRVTALPYYNGDKWADSCIGGIIGAERWRGAFKGAKTSRVGSLSTNRTIENIIDAMHKYGPGARGVVHVSSADLKNGHVFNVENVNGRVQFLEAQTGSRYNRSELRSFLGHTPGIQTTLTRTDNLRISDRAREFVRQGRK